MARRTPIIVSFCLALATARHFESFDFENLDLGGMLQLLVWHVEVQVDKVLS
jgi:hypothetical protein